MKYDLVRKYAVAFMRVFAQQVATHDQEIYNIVHFLITKRREFFEFSMFALHKRDRDLFIVQFLKHVRLPHYFFSLVQLLLQHGRFDLFIDVLQMIGALMREQNNVQEISVYSAHPLSGKDIAKIENFMFRRRQRTISRMTCVISPDLIAGIRIESDEFIWEYSVRKQLTTINAILRQEGIRYE